MVYLARAQLLLDMTLTIQKANELAILFGVYAFIDHPARDSKEGKILKDDSDPYTGRGERVLLAEIRERTWGAASVFVPPLLLPCTVQTALHNCPNPALILQCALSI